MNEKIIRLDFINPLDFFGINDQNIEFIRGYFPKLKIIARDNLLKVLGEPAEIESFEETISILIKHYNAKGFINTEIIQQVLNADANTEQLSGEPQNDIIIHGQNGILIRAKTPNQRALIESCRSNDLIFAVGPAGTGKTYTSVALAVRALRNKEVKRIILTRPAVEAGENLGFLPGDLKDKLDPYMQPLYDALWDMLPTQKLRTYIEERIIEIAPLAYMRGRTLDNAFVILDEAQNSTINQMKMFLTRMGRTAKFIVTGDITQIDLPKNQASGLVNAIEILKGIKGIDIIYFNNADIIRHKLITEIINAYNKEK
ncbi:MAG: PhoH family protein [Bacteroidales bacterium]|jgi:phosphate starvation-inducible PhoH-like protein|nr:PhoH family protein [Bacteroidales bacterium]MDD4214073.1 PhoH family protein [Bacteroidales bacterium]